MSRARVDTIDMAPGHLMAIGPRTDGQVRMLETPVDGKWQCTLFVRPGLSSERLLALADIAADAIAAMVASGFDGAEGGWKLSDYEPGAWYINITRRPIVAPV